SLVIVYAIAVSLWTIDLIMSLQPGWASTLFPAYIFTGNLYGAIAALSVAAAAGPRLSAGQVALDESAARELAKLLLGFPYCSPADIISTSPPCGLAPG